MGRSAMAVMTAVLLATASGCTMLAQAQGTVSAEAQKRECERNGGYWVTSSGFCKIGA